MHEKNSINFCSYINSVFFFFFFKSSGAFCTLQVLRMMVGVNISDEQLGSIADRTIQEADQDGDSAISFAEFVKVGKLHF